jgi:predicted phage tail protein
MIAIRIIHCCLFGYIEGWFTSHKLKKHVTTTDFVEGISWVEMYCPEFAYRMRRSWYRINLHSQSKLKII